MANVFAEMLMFLFVLIFSSFTAGSRVLELSDRFLEVGKEGMWLVMFYAPWCGHCKKLDPIWNQVSQSMYATPVHVGRVDCTRFTNVASEYNVKGFPTILFIKENEIFNYGGDRIREDIVDFAMRLSGPMIRSLEKPEDLTNALNKHTVFYLYVGNDQDSSLWGFYQSVAENFITTTYFYYSSPSILKEEIPSEDLPKIFVFKDDKRLEFEVPEKDDINNTLSDWVNKERFVLFPKVTHGNFNHLLLTEKYLAVAVVEENKVGNVPQEMRKFRDIFKSIAHKHGDKYKKMVQFGWLGHPEIANSVAMETLPVPSFIVINSTTFQHHLPEDDPSQLTEEVIVTFIDQVLNQSASAYGGNNIFYRIYRMYYEIKTSLSDMWYGNPVLTAVLFGMPLGFLSLICYSICCSDIMEASDEEELLLQETEKKHVKKE